MAMMNVRTKSGGVNVMDGREGTRISSKKLSLRSSFFLSFNRRISFFEIENEIFHEVVHNTSGRTNEKKKEICHDFLKIFMNLLDN